MCSDEDTLIRDRIFDSERASNSNYNEPLFELTSGLQNVYAACVMSANIPFTYNTFDSTNNTFKVSISDQTPTGGTLGSLATCTIPPQSINSNQLPNEILNAMADAGFTTTNLRCYVDETNTNVVIYTIQGTPPTITFDFSGSNSAYSLLGFLPTTYTATTQAILGYTVRGNDGLALASTYPIIVGPRTINLSGPSQLYIHDRKFGPAMNGGVKNDTAYGDIIGDIAVNANYQGTITYQAPFETKFDCQMNSIKQVSLYLTVGNSTTPLDLKGAKYQIKIRFFCRKKEPNTVGNDGYGNGNVYSVGSGADFKLRSDVRPRQLKRQALFM